MRRAHSFLTSRGVIELVDRWSRHRLTFFSND